MQNVRYDKFCIASYLNSPLFNNNNRVLLLALRTRTVRGIRNDFKGLYNNNECPLGCGDIDTLENILTCNIIKKYHESRELSHGNIKYEDIFSGNIHQQHRITELYSQLLQTRNNLIINGTPVADSTGPVHGALTVQN